MSVDPPASGSFPQLATPSLEGQILDGRYKITKRIGEGGMGEVYAAEHVHIEKKFAIKLLKAEIVSNAEAVKRFRQEARSSSSIGHRNIIAIEDFGQLSDGRIYMCMELLNGAALNDMITQPMPADRLLNILIQTGHGLAAAHAKGIIHRDMKPENIFVTIGPSGEDVPKLLDFGIAKVSGNDGQNHLTRTGTIFGTPFYMAPEQALGNPVDARTDIYAVGVIMYECFSGSLPFQGESFMGILTQHITTEPEPVAQRALKAGRQLPMGLAEIITRCMQKNPAQRFGTMDELVNALISVYRGIAGPGMSTYMEAFPVGSSGHVPQPTPSPSSFSGGMHTPHPGHMPPAQPPGTGGYAAPSQPQIAPGASGVYDPSASSSIVAPKRSKMGLIIAIFAVLIVGGGIAAFTLLSNKDDKKQGDGSGSQIASNDPGSGSQKIVTPPVGSDEVKPAAPDAQQTVKTGSDTVKTGSDEVTPPPAELVDVLVMTSPNTSFEVWADGKKLIDGPDNVQVTKGAALNVTLKAKGFKDKQLVLDGSKRKMTIKLDRIPGQSHPTNVTQPPPGKDCTEKLLDVHDKKCQAQYCAAHPNLPACDAE